jgi:hypothetical protein
MKDTVFFRQAELLLRILPLIHREEVFASKGGTAINFFVRDLLGLEAVENLPAVKWKLLNIRKMEPSKHRDAVRKLRDYLGK